MVAAKLFQHRRIRTPARLARLDRSKTQTIEQNLTKLLRRIDVKITSRMIVYLLPKLFDTVADLNGHPFQQLNIQRNPIPFHARQYLNKRHLNFFKKLAYSRLLLKPFRKILIKQKRNISILGCILTRHLRIDHIERDLLFPLTDKLRDRHTLITQKISRHIIHRMAPPFRIETIRSNHRIEINPANRHLRSRKNKQVIFNILPDLLNFFLGQYRSKLAANQ